MVQKICPICDHKLNGTRFCSNCKQWVKKPNTIKVDYYLNERHPQEWHDCDYHDGTSNQAGRSAPSGSARYTGPAQTAQTSQQGRKQTAAPMGGSKAGGNKTAGGSRAGVPGQTVSRPVDKPKKKSSSSVGNLVGVIIVAVVVLLQVAGPVMELVVDSFGDIIENTFVTKTPEPAIWEPEETLEAGELTDQEVKELGQECSLFGHMDLQTKDVQKILERGLEDRFIIHDEYEYSSNYRDGENTWFQSSHQYDLESSLESGGYANVSVYADTCTGRVHEIDLYAESPEDTAFLMEEILNILIASGSLPETPEAGGSWQELLTAGFELEEYYFIEDEALKRQGMEIIVSKSKSEYDGAVTYYVDFWKAE